MIDMVKKTFKYKKTVLIIILMIVLYISINYICSWESQMKLRFRFIAGIDMDDGVVIGKNIFRESRFFPVTKNDDKAESKNVKYYYENGYGDGRTFGGIRKHEGIDIMSSKNQNSLFKIRAVSDGIVEKKGWLKLGGYRIGIRSERGIYYYYAHLASYRENIKCGDRVKAGEVIGYMGNTGYGDEGTSGRFWVHLHFGIYVKDGNNEKSINPYYLLKSLESKAE